MKSKIRLLWMQMHSVIACFFLPLIILYVCSGLLYLFGFEGNSIDVATYSLELPNGWPTSEQQAFNLVEPFIIQGNHRGKPKKFYLEKNEYASWHNRRREFVLLSTANPNAAEFHIDEHDFWQQILLIHKGYAGPLFWLLSIGFGLHLVFSGISGLILVFQLPKLKKAALLSTVSGLMTTTLLFFIS